MIPRRRSLSCRGIIIDEEGWITIVYDFMSGASGADVNAHYIGTRLLPITDGRLSPRLIHKCRSLGWSRRRTHSRNSQLQLGWVCGETHATYRITGHSARVVSRRLPRHNYPTLVYLRPLFNLQLMFQIAINPTHSNGCHLSTMITDCTISAIQHGLSP